MIKKAEKVHGKDFVKLRVENEIMFLNYVWPLY